MDAPNRYEVPTYLSVGSSRFDRAKSGRGRMLYVAWTAVFALNTALPLNISWRMTGEHGRAGMSVAALLLLALGWLVCAFRRSLAAPLIAGALLIGVTQLMPAAQIIAGLIGMAVGKVLGLATFGDEATPPRVSTEFGGFVVTLVTGGLLLAASAGCGLLIRFFSPDRWWRKSVQSGEV